MLLFNKKATAKEMLDWGFISRIIPHDVFEERTKAIVEEFAQLPAGVSIISDKLENIPGVHSTK